MPDSVARGVLCGLAEGLEEIWIEFGHSRNRVIEDRHTVGDDTVSLAKRTTVLTARTIQGWCCGEGP